MSPLVLLLVLGLLPGVLSLYTRDGFCKSEHCSLKGDNLCTCKSPVNFLTRFKVRRINMEKIQFLCPSSKSFNVKDDLAPLGISLSGVRSLILTQCANSPSNNIDRILSSLNISDTLGILSIEPTANLTTHSFSTGTLIHTLLINGLWTEDEAIFSPLSDSLTELQIVNSKLDRFPEGIFHNISQLQTLRVAENTNLLPSEAFPEGLFQPLTNSLETLNISNNHILELHPKIFHLHNLLNLKLEGNLIKVLPYNLLHGSPNLESFIMEDSCPTRQDNCHRVFNSTFLSKQNHLNQFEYKSPGSGDHIVNATIHNDFLGANAATIQVFDVQNIDINVPDLKKLLYGCTNLTNLRVQNSSLSRIGLGVEDLPSLEEADLCNNLNLGCECEKNMDTLMTWFDEKKLKVNQKTCLVSNCSNGSMSLEKENLVKKSNCTFGFNATNSAVVSDNNSTNIMVVVLVILVVVIVAILTIIYRKKRTGIADQELGFNTSGSFDAFLSYSEHDSKFAHTIRGKLVRHGLNICYHEEHFKPSVRVQQNILTNVQDSKWLLIVLSPAFLQSNWCTSELNTAISCKKRVLIVLRGEAEMDAALRDADDEVRSYVRNHTYIKEGDERLMTKMLDTLIGRRGWRRFCRWSFCRHR